MLILTRKPGESIYIGDEIIVRVVEIKGSQVRVGIEAPAKWRIYREEIYEQIRRENEEAAAALNANDSGLEGLSVAWADDDKAQGKPVSKVRGLGSLKSKAPNPTVVIRRKKDTVEDE